MARQRARGSRDAKHPDRLGRSKAVGFGHELATEPKDVASALVSAPRRGKKKSAG
jgi:hypothetical protein